MTVRLFALERYERSGGPPAPVPVVGLTTADTRLRAAVHLAADDVVLALIEGPDADTVAAAARNAGWRVDRLTDATWISSPYSDSPDSEESSTCDGGSHSR